MNLKELLSNIEFDYKIIKDEDKKNAIQLVDETGVNFGHIEDDIFYNVADVIDRTEQYWKDYVIDDTKKRVGLSEDSTWEDVYKTAVLKDDIATDILRSIVYPETVDVEEFTKENSMNHDETLIFEDLQALSNEEDSALPEFNRVKIYNPRDYGLLPDGNKIHVLAEYNGNEKEDAVFNQLNDKDFPSEFNGVEIDWNPISVEQSGTIEQYLEFLVITQEKFEKEKESYNVSNIIKETSEQTVKNIFGNEIKNEQDLIEIYNKNESSIHPNAFQELPNQVANDILYAINSDDKKLFEKDGKFVIRANDENPKNDVLLSSLELLENVENRMEHWYEEKQLSEDEVARLGRLHWFDNGMRFPDGERVNGSLTSYTQCFDLLQSHFPEITKEESELIFDAMEKQNYVVYAGKYGVFVEDYTDTDGRELNQVDLPTLAEYALGDTSLSKEQQDILWNLVPNVNHGKMEEKNMETKQLDTIDTERMDELAVKAYHKYQYEWLSERNISLEDISEEMDAALEEYMEETNGERIDAWQQLRNVIDNGIDGEMFASLDEFKTNEFLDPKSVEAGHLLEGHDHDEYLSHIQAYAKSLGVEIENPIRELDSAKETKKNAQFEKTSDFVESSKKNLEIVGNILKNDDDILVENKEAGKISIEKGNVGKSGNGLQHIIEQRFEKDGRSVDEISAMLSLVVTAASEGEISRDVKIFQNEKDIGTLDLEKNGIIAFVSKSRDGTDEKFVITGFDDSKNKRQAEDAMKTVIAEHSYTPEFAIVKEQVGATLVSAYRLHQKELERNKEILQSANNKNIAKQAEKKIKDIENAMKIYENSDTISLDTKEKLHTDNSYENPKKETVTVRHELANSFIDRQSDSAKENIKSSLESIKSIPLDIYTLMDDKGNSKESYLVSQTINGNYQTHLINENGLHWGHYDIPSELQAQSQAAKRAANRSLENIKIIENYNTFSSHRREQQQPLAQAIWDREDVKFAIANNPDSKIDESQVTDKQIDDVISNLNTKRLEEAMVETGWTYIDQAVSETIEMNKEQEHRLDNIYVADKNRKVGLEFIPELQYNSETEKNDTPHITVVSENTITGLKFTDTDFKEKVSEDVFLKTPFIDKFVERTAEKYGITKDKIDYISKEDFEAISQDRKSITPLKEQKPLERWTRMTQDVMFKKGIEDTSENTDKILSIAKDNLKSFSADEKKQCQFNLSLDSKYKSEKEALAHTLGSGYTHDLCENIKRNQIRAKKRDDEGISR